MSEKRVLVVDDDAAIRQMFITLLQREGYQVDVADDGTDGLKRMRSDNYSVVLLDLMMPAASGFEVLEILARDDPKKLERVIVTTGASRSDLRKLDTNQVCRRCQKVSG